MQESQKRVVLLLDDNENMLRILVRMLRRRFDAVLTATNARQAAALLRRNDVTTLVCDHGIGNPSGGELIARWRERYPAIERAVVLTGAHIEDVTVPPEVDVLLSKNNDMKDIITEIGRPPNRDGE